jgi:transcription elongation factor GreB
MTQEGVDAIQAEIAHLWHVERPEIVRQVHAAAEQGDRSENAAYIYGKKRLREIDSRLRYLRKKIDQVQVIDLSSQPDHPDIRFGAVVTVLDDEEQATTWRLVDQEESDPSVGRISVQSPVGRALLGRAVGDWVEVALPRGKVGYEVTAIRYGGGEP